MIMNSQSTRMGHTKDITLAVDDVISLHYELDYFSCESSDFSLWWEIFSQI